MFTRILEATILLAAGYGVVKFFQDEENLQKVQNILDPENWTSGESTDGQLSNA